LDQLVHWDISFLFPRRVDSAIAGLEEAKNLAGESPPPDSDRNEKRFYQNPAEIVNPKRSERIHHIIRRVKQKAAMR
jgi:hypothetical protein